MTAARVALRVLTSWVLPALAACAATPNPGAPLDPASKRAARAQPTPSTPSSPNEAGAPGALGALGALGATGSAPDGSAGAAAAEDSIWSRPGGDDSASRPGNRVTAPAGAAAEGERLSIGRVGGEELDVRSLLERLWLRDSQSMREVFEYLVMSRIAVFEADRLGVSVDPERVDATMQRARGELEKKLADSGKPTTLAQHIQRTLEMDEATWTRKLRSEAIVQLLTERCVRAWYLSNPRVRLRLTELPDRAALERAQALLAGGSTLAEVARALGRDEDAAQGGTAMVVVRSEASELARLAFATPVGEIGGPLAQEGRFLLVQPEERLEPLEGPWRDVGPRVEESLAAIPIDTDKLEYVQWRTAMMRRYPIDLGPFLRLVEGTVP